jgi:glycosyltransferase involved in cell wall biosynthesis
MYKLAYITVEDVSSGLFKTQVLNNLIALSIKYPKIKINIYCINRIWHLSKNINSIKKINFLIKNNKTNIKIIYLPFLPPLRGGLKSRFYLNFIIYYLKFLISFINLRKFNAVHIRSYWPLLAIKHLDLKNIIFDPRSLWLDESISSGDLVDGSDEHKLLNSLERACIESSKIICVVSQPMVNYYRSISPLAHIKLVPISFLDGEFFFDKYKREEIRKKLNIETNLVYVYSGSFGQSGVNISAILQIFDLILENKNARLLVLTNEKESVINRLIIKVRANSRNMIVLSSGVADLKNFLSAADIGVHALPPQKDSDSRLGTKVIEYWACGLPVLVNQYVGAAAAIINEFTILGEVLDLDVHHNSFQVSSMRIAKLDRGIISKFALDNFSAEKIATLYLDAYLDNFKK